MSWSIESGYDHKCPACGGTWYDSDGGCGCEVESEAKEDEDCAEDSAIDGQ